jgi:hypothetical protein
LDFFFDLDPVVVGFFQIISASCAAVVIVPDVWPPLHPTPLHMIVPSVSYCDVDRQGASCHRSGRLQEKLLTSETPYQHAANKWFSIAGEPIWIADPHRGNGQRFVARADERLTAFLELERPICLRLLSGIARSKNR